jgi:DNA polymerase/3'-5' exonuclease PolX
MGSYRRGEETSGDLDILISRDPSDGGTHSGQSIVEACVTLALMPFSLSPGVILKLVKELVALGIICHTVSSAWYRSPP